MFELMREGCRRHFCEVGGGLERNQLEALFPETMDYKADFYFIRRANTGVAMKAT